MAFLRAEFMSACLERTVSVSVVLPCDVTNFRGLPPIPAAPPYKTLYLLHGIYGSDMDWVLNTNIQRLARERQMVVVMPAGENHFYTDAGTAGARYGEFIGRELVETTRKMFRLSDRREDTSIAGLSMGAYGAYMNGLKYPDTFGHVACLSMAVIDKEYFTNESRLISPLTDSGFARGVFGDTELVAENLKTQTALTNRVLEEGATLPELYFAIGTEDFLLAENRAFHAFLTDRGVRHVYKEAPGTHSFDFWGREIVDILDWLPHGEKLRIQSSGNVLFD